MEENLWPIHDVCDKVKEVAIYSSLYSILVFQSCNISKDTYNLSLFHILPLHLQERLRAQLESFITVVFNHCATAQCLVCRGKSSNFT